MLEYYCTFWYPTIFLSEPCKTNIAVINTKIDDESLHKFEVELAIDNNENIKIRSTIVETEEHDENLIVAEVDFEIILTPIGRRSNGFIQYKFNFDLTDKIKKNIEKLSAFKSDDDKIEAFRNYFKEALSRPIYHYIKQFYHVHETIANSTDSALIAVCFETEDDFIRLNNRSTSNDNRYLQGFLNSFQEVFKARARHVSDFNLALTELFNSFTKKYGSDQRIIGNETTVFWRIEDFNKIPPNDLELFTKRLQELYEACEDTLIEYTYCKTLLHSIYNKYYRHDTEEKLEIIEKDIIIELEQISDITEKTNQQTSKYLRLEFLKELRRNALNIRNSVRYIENVKYKNQNRQYVVSRIMLAKVQEQNATIANVVASVQEQNDAITNVVASVQEQNTTIAQMVTSVGEQNNGITKMLTASGATTKISIAFAIFGTLVTILSSFSDDLKNVFFNINFSWFNFLHIMLSLTLLVFIICTVIIYRKKLKARTR